MKHNIRQRQLDPNTGLIVTKIVKVEGELGGWFDKNDKEVFEGDVIRHDSGTLFTVTSRDGALIIDLGKLFIDFGNENLIPLFECDKQKFEIVGHVDD